MDWAKGLVRSIINVQNHQIASMQSWLDANPTLAKDSEMCYETMPYNHPDCPDSLAVMGALALGLLVMDF